MPPPIPLTAAPTPRLDWSREATPIAEDFGDVYFSTDGGLDEARTVFLKGCGLPMRWADGIDHVIGELGFGSGLNFLTTWQAFEDVAAPQQKLDFISVEKFPFTRDMMRKALSHWPQLAKESARLIALWPGPVKGVHRLHLSPNITLTLYIDDVMAALGQMSALVDSWFLDGFNPSKNPNMWSTEIMRRVSALSHGQTRLATFTVAGEVRSALIESGFSVDKKEGFGRKRHRLEAHIKTGSKPPQKPDVSALVIGGGIAAASLCHAARRKGFPLSFIHNDEDMAFAASANPAALVKPRLDLQDREESRFFLASYLYALRVYEDSCTDDSIIHSRGITQIAKHEAELARFKKIAAQAPLPAQHLTQHPRGLNFPSALTIKPKALISSWIDGAKRRIATVTQIEKDGEIWQARDETGQIIASSKIMIIASGAGLRDIKLPSGETIAAHLSLRFSRGQLTWARGRVNASTAYGGYAIPMDDNILLGATHERLDSRDDYALRPEDDLHNLDQVRKYLDPSIQPLARKGRAALRVTTANTLPQVINLQPGLWVMTGLGSRGFVFAPLLAENLVSHLMQKAPSLTPALWGKFSADK